MSFSPEEYETREREQGSEFATRCSLLIRDGSGRLNETVQIGTGNMTIGRSPECDLFLDDITVSRIHAVLISHDSGISIEDQKSLNGTFVNRKLVDKVELEDADEIRVGRYRLTFLNR